MTTDSHFFQIGGALDEDSPCYIERPADRELLDALKKGDLCLVLSPRQTGKSSLMVHARSRLKALEITAGIVDLQLLGSQYDQDAWYSDVVFQIKRSLKLKTDVTAWWDEHRKLGPNQRFITFMEDVVLSEIKGRVVIFFDEIDSVLSLPFSDDFFTTIRSIFNARASNPILKRLNFVILGVATPSEFIKSRKRTPFNIGRQIELGDFDSSSLVPFKEVLGADSDKIIDRIFYWTAGQPLMVQKLTDIAYIQPVNERSVENVDETVRKTYIDTTIEKDTHLKFIRDYLVEDNRKLRKTLNTYRSVLERKEVPFDEKSPVHSRLKLAGVVCVDEKGLTSRNRIYERVFDENWVKRNTPKDKTKIIAYGASSTLVLVLLWFFLLQPLLFLEFSKHQTLNWQDEDVYYTEQTSFTFDMQLPGTGIKKIMLDGREITSGSPGEKQNINKVTMKLESLSVGASEHTLRFYGGLWKENFETRVLIVSYPVAYWKSLNNIEVVMVPKGCFDMGDTFGDENDDERPVHEVCINDFYIGKYEVTQGEWENIMGHNPSSFKKGERYPVENVSWNHVWEYLRRLNKLSGIEYRLPTEAEWEFAAREGGKKIKYAGTSNDAELYIYANFCDKNCEFGWKDESQDDGFENTAPVGSYKPNGLALFDMSGNVWEWCQDWYDEYNKSITDNPKGPESGSNRVIRGGSWGGNAQYCRSAYRDGIRPGSRDYDVGFRLARSVGP